MRHREKREPPLWLCNLLTHSFTLSAITAGQSSALLKAAQMCFCVPDDHAFSC